MKTYRNFLCEYRHFVVIAGIYSLSVLAGFQCSNVGAYLLIGMLENLYKISKIKPIHKASENSMIIVLFSVHDIIAICY